MANILNPDIVQNAHIEFLKAGSTIITTNNYAAIPKCLRFDHLIDLEIINGGTGRADAPNAKSTIDQVLRETGFFKGSNENNNKQVLYKCCYLKILNFKK